jgi:hypothetical protein
MKHQEVTDEGYFEILLEYGFDLSICVSERTLKITFGLVVPELLYHLNCKSA